MCIGIILEKSHNVTIIYVSLPYYYVTHFMTFVKCYVCVLPKVTENFKVWPNLFMCDLYNCASGHFYHIFIYFPKYLHIYVCYLMGLTEIWAKLPIFWLILTKVTLIYKLVITFLFHNITLCFKRQVLSLFFSSLAGPSFIQSLVFLAWFCFLLQSFGVLIGKDFI